MSNFSIQIAEEFMSCKRSRQVTLSHQKNGHVISSKILIVSSKRPKKKKE